ncbi:PREDICTED: GTP-binding protein Rheb homolog isoform X2 [Priapulus caudatus]|uniref:GTP-binding protein Rheb homolog isoform X2 n=1 Tax=Priapulus caudatus TaxID=37621 RepID=A0ABM1DSG7_PRICU|nr:PREDICTED: GTP-binding protein Rheb homolog isoform X2 [Priapulus caudatus]
MPPPKQRKIALMGFRSVGKSSLTIQFVDGQFVDSYDPTIENTFSKDVKSKGQLYECKVVDTAGQDEYSIIPQSYVMDIHGYILVYAITSNKSFEVVKVIHDKLLDMTGKVKRVSTDDGKKLADSWKAMFLETSAKENESVTDMFECILQEIEKSEGNVPEKSGCVIS